MTRTVLLYGAAGYSGRLIAREAANRWGQDGGLRLILGGRNSGELEEIAARHRVGHRVFGLDRPEWVSRALRDVDVVINAAGPFGATAVPLVRAAIAAGCHYVDINGEFDVYRRLDDFDWNAHQREVAIVCGAGHTAAASDLMLNEAFQQPCLSDARYRDAQAAPAQRRPQLGAIRIALSRLDSYSRGSAATVLRSLRQQVAVVHDIGRGGEQIDPKVSYVPVGALERRFDFGTTKGGRGRVRVAGAASLIDTLTARLRVMRLGYRVRVIESYVESGPVARIVAPLAGLAAPLLWLRGVHALATAQIALLPEGPSAQDLAHGDNAVVLTIDDQFGRPLVDWHLKTPNAYLFSARIAVAVAESLANIERFGWLTPADVLAPALSLRKPDQTTALRDCELTDRLASAEEKP